MGTSVTTVVEYNYDAQTKDWVPVRKTVATTENKNPYSYTTTWNTANSNPTAGYTFNQRPKTEKEWTDFVASQIKKVVDKSQEWL